ncbi:hypothetical protein BQ8482_300019 [Mesorhizobium delmotii]|uniref:Uncharacterized protein n=1 Tax=Mesorhizobium delmotii TaxID=1631247 RepID=A0A2P9ANK0_9HYPH|nr:hypothetical protein BQ8482_300019 [Mesorhizobium delmotii]
MPGIAGAVLGVTERPCLTSHQVRRIYIYESIWMMVVMAKPKPGRRDPKALARDGALNPRPEAARDTLFAGNPFFDARDLVQVRYEMVRRHQADRTATSPATSGSRGRPSTKLRAPWPARASPGWCLGSGVQRADTRSLPRSLPTSTSSGRRGPTSPGRNV